MGFTERFANYRVEKAACFSHVINFTVNIYNLPRGVLRRPYKYGRRRRRRAQRSNMHIQRRVRVWTRSPEFNHFFVVYTRFPIAFGARNVHGFVTDGRALLYRLLCWPTAPDGLKTKTRFRHVRAPGSAEVPGITDNAASYRTILIAFKITSIIIIIIFYYSLVRRPRLARAPSIKDRARSAPRPAFAQNHCVLWRPPIVFEKNRYN